MSHAALTQRYRPQTFADVAGQATLKAILSRASAEDKVAPAYLFSGTRGVGKTTIARIFAKALNCKKGPAAEPCNECENCRAITLGSSVDVVEIDGASNRGIDDVRRLKESVGYAPMDGRYKIFIIDEAHMLSREAFNALLKTLEEPPARVTFIMATTEAHKFPVTILSRCQHYVFKRLSDVELEAHLTKILQLEKCPFEASAVRLIVRRAAGSVRDAMSLLGQVLALGSEGLTEADTRIVLGLAGQELFFKLLSLIKAADCPGISTLVREMLDQGLDLGFFLRELSSMWRNLFMLCQSGEAARSVVDLPEAEVERWLEEAKTFDLGHIHAAWQMSLEGQRRVLTSLEPALALELLLLNLAMLPKLLSLEQLSLLSRKVAPTEAEKKSPIIEQTATTEPEAKVSLKPENSTQYPREPEQFQYYTPDIESVSQADEATFTPVTQPAATEASAAAHLGPKAERAYTEKALHPSELPWNSPEGRALEEEPSKSTIAQADTIQEHSKASLESKSAEPVQAGRPENSVTDNAATDRTTTDNTDAATTAIEAAPSLPEEVSKANSSKLEDPQDDERNWAAFVRFCAELAQDSAEISASFSPLLNKLKANWNDNGISLQPPDAFSAERLNDKEQLALLKNLLTRFCGQETTLNILPPPDREQDKKKLIEHLHSIPAIKALQETLNAEFVDYGPWRG